METINNKTLEKLKYELVRDGIVSYETLEKAEELADVQNINIGQALINSGILSEDTLLKFLESKLHIPYVNLEDYNPDPKCFNYVAFADARRYRIIPLFKIEEILTVAMADPLDLFAIDKIIEMSTVAKRWEEKFKMADKCKDEFLNLSICQEVAKIINESSVNEFDRKMKSNSKKIPDVE